jgi:hypothetical protein
MPLKTLGRGPKKSVKVADDLRWCLQCKTTSRDFGSSSFSMESHAMPEPKFDLDIWGIKISAQGFAGICAAVLVVGMLLVVYRY